MIIGGKDCNVGDLAVIVGLGVVFLSFFLAGAFVLVWPFTDDMVPNVLSLFGLLIMGVSTATAGAAFSDLIGR